MLTRLVITAIAAVIGTTAGHPAFAEGRLGCVDARGHQAECGVNGREIPTECIAGPPPFGICPGDPHCFDGKGKEIQCVFPVKPVVPPRISRPRTG